MARRALLQRLGDVDIRLLRIFAAVAERGGLAASEFELNINRSTISKHLSDLEMRLGVTLCARGPGGFSLTEEGARVLDAAHELLRSIERFQNDVEDIHANLSGTLRFGLFDQSTTNPEAHLDAAIRAFDDIAPDVMLEIRVEPPNVIEAQVVDGALDIAVVPLHRRSSSLDYTVLYDERMSLYCGRGHPLFDAPEDEEIDLSAFKYAGFGFNSPNLNAGERLALRKTAKVQDEEALSLLIQSGRYLGFLSDHVAVRFERAGAVRVVRPSRTSYVSTFAAISRKRAAADRKTMAFLECLRAAHPKTRPTPASPPS